MGWQERVLWVRVGEGKSREENGGGIGGAHWRDYRGKLRTKVIRPWRLERAFGIIGGLCVCLVLFFSAAE